MDSGLVVSLHYPPLSFYNGSMIERELLRNPPVFVVHSQQQPSVLNMAYTLVLYDADNFYLHWLIVNHSTSHERAIVDYLPPDTQLPGRDGLVRRLGVAVLVQRTILTAVDITEMTVSVRRGAPFDFPLVQFAAQDFFVLVDYVIMYYSALAIYEVSNGARYLAAAEGVVTALQPYAPAPAPGVQHVYSPAFRWGSFSACESIYRIYRIAQSNLVTPGGRFIITYPTARRRQPDVFHFPTLHLSFIGLTVTQFYVEYVNLLPFHLRPAAGGE